LTHPLERLGDPAARRAFWLVLLATLAAMLTLASLDGALRTAAAPRGIVSFELAGSLPAAESMLDSWGESGRLRAGFSLGLDYLFLVLYANAIALAVLLVARRIPGSALARVAALLAWGQYAAAAFDAVENAALAQLLFGAREELWPRLALFCALPKFALVAAGILYAVVGGVTAAVGRSRS